MATTNQLVNNYTDFFKEKFVIEHLDGADEILTPFTDNLNDFISVYIERNTDGTLTLTDNGNTIDELELLGLEWNTKTRKKILNSILINYGVELDEITGCLSGVQNLIFQLKNMDSFKRS